MIHFLIVTGFHSVVRSPAIHPPLKKVCDWSLKWPIIRRLTAKYGLLRRLKLHLGKVTVITQM